jgi:glycosyltransferase involved in cell wall biosynthesis
MMKIKIPLSVAIITKNEEEKLPDCLKSVSFADEIVVVDSGSVDETVKIAKDFGCKVFIEEWKGFGPQKKSAIRKCKNEWVLIIDADERVPMETEREIIKIINNVDTADAYSFPRKNYYRDKWIRHCGWWPDFVIRLFKKSKGTVDDAIVHESVKVDGKVQKVTSPLIHYPIKDLKSVIDKINLYSSLGADNLYLNKKNVSTFTAFLLGITAFLKFYILKLGIFDGYEGFVISFSHAVNTCYKYLKLKENTLISNRV